MDSLAILILAAGLGKRMGSNSPKVLARTCTKPIIEHVLEFADAVDPDSIVIVTGYGKELVEEAVKKGAETSNYRLDRIQFAFQENQLGTGHAAKAALPNLEGFEGTVCILYGDTPLLKPENIKTLIGTHHKKGAAVSIITLIGDNTNAYGRIIREESGEIDRIIEVKDCTPAQRLIDETNAGIYAVDASFLRDAVSQLDNKNAQNEYYLTDIVGIAHSQNKKIGSISLHDPFEIQGVNTLHDLSLVNSAIIKSRVKPFIDKGVKIEDPSSLYVDETVEIEPGAQIGPQVILKGNTKIGKDVVIEGSAFLKDTIVKDGAYIKFCVRTEDAEIGKNAAVGPFAHLRPGSVLEEKVKVGNFVETKKTHLSKGAKASHLTYLGDADIGQDVNIGAGTITCNYDGYIKQRTVIEEGAFIGSNSALVAPVKVSSGATIGAGSVISGEVKKDDLVVTRASLKTIPDWSKKKRERHKNKK